jgi:hypothetical protein
VSSKAKFVVTPGEYLTKERPSREVVIVAVVEGRALGYFVVEGPDYPQSWAVDGGFFYREDRRSPVDLIDPNQPKRIKKVAWLTLRADMESDGIICFGGYATKEMAKKAAHMNCNAIARVEIDCLEGDNLE